MTVDGFVSRPTIPPDHAVTDAEWDALVEWWNAPTTRLKHRHYIELCRGKGHDFHPYPIADSRVCVRCLTYREDPPDARHDS